MILSEAALKNFKLNPEKIYFYNLKDSYSGKRCLEIIEKLKNKLSGYGSAKVAICAPNSVEWALWYILLDSFAKNIFLISSDFDENLIKKICKKYQINTLIFQKKDDENFEIFKMSQQPNKLKKYNRKDVIFTSGTTGIPKAAIIPQNSYIHVAKELIKITSQNDADLEMLSMPLDRSFGLVRLRTCILSGASALIVDGLKKFPSVFKFSQINLITGLSVVPAALQVIAVQLRNKAKDFTKNLKYIELGSSSLIENQLDWIKENCKKSIVIHHYGMTESSRAFIRSLHMVSKENYNWIGKPLAGVKFKIQSLNNNSEIGELFLKGSNLFQGYLEEDDTNARLIDNWFLTGDICEKKDGKLFLVGRKDNQLNIAGVKVQAERIEAMIENHPNVNECLCFEYPDKFLGNTIAALIVLKEDTEEDLKAIIDRVFNNKPSYYKPQKLKNVVSLPKTFNGKKERDKYKLIEKI